MCSAAAGRLRLCRRLRTRLSENGQQLGTFTPREKKICTAAAAPYSTEGLAVVDNASAALAPALLRLIAAA
jgi:hypothetical protein